MARPARERAGGEDEEAIQGSRERLRNGRRRARAAAAAAAAAKSERRPQGTIDASRPHGPHACARRRRPVDLVLAERERLRRRPRSRRARRRRRCRSRARRARRTPRAARGAPPRRRPRRRAGLARGARARGPPVGQRRAALQDALLSDVSRFFFVARSNAAAPGARAPALAVAPPPSARLAGAPRRRRPRPSLGRRRLALRRSRAAPSFPSACRTSSAGRRASPGPTAWALCPRSRRARACGAAALAAAGLGVPPAALAPLAAAARRRPPALGGAGGYAPRAEARPRSRGGSRASRAPASRRRERRRGGRGRRRGGELRVWLGVGLRTRRSPRTRCRPRPTASGAPTAGRPDRPRRPRGRRLGRRAPVSLAGPRPRSADRAAAALLPLAGGGPVLRGARRPTVGVSARGARPPRRGRRSAARRPAARQSAARGGSADTRPRAAARAATPRVSAPRTARRRARTPRRGRRSPAAASRATRPTRGRRAAPRRSAAPPPTPTPRHPRPVGGGSVERERDPSASGPGAPRRTLPSRRIPLAAADPRGAALRALQARRAVAASTARRPPRRRRRIRQRTPRCHIARCNKARLPHSPLGVSRRGLERGPRCQFDKGIQEESEFGDVFNRSFRVAPSPSRSMAEVDPAVAAAAAANDGTAELAAATDAVLQRDLPQRPCAGINEFLSVIGAEPLLRSLNHAGRAGVARWSQTRVAAARSVLLDQARARRARPVRPSHRRPRPLSCPQLGFDDARVWRTSRNLRSAAPCGAAGDAGVGPQRRSTCWAAGAASRRRGSTSGTRARREASPSSLYALLPLFLSRSGSNIGDAAQALAPELPHPRAGLLKVRRACSERDGSLAGALTRASPPVPLAQRNNIGDGRAPSLRSSPTRAST